VAAGPDNLDADAGIECGRPDHRPAGPDFPLGHTGGHFPPGTFDLHGLFVNGFWDTGHTWCEGLLHLYLTTGNRRFLEAGRQRCPAGHRDLPSLIWALGLFDDYYRELIHAFKFHGRTDCGEFLADRLADSVAADRRSAAVACVVPVPLHSARRRERGFNQSRLLAARIAARLERPLIDATLWRRRNTTTQTQLSVEARRDNVAGAFAVRPAEPLPDTVLLVDDVLTTGATLAACAAALQEAGAREILGAVVALAE